jgi:tetratricopeptide (TPR) repeat protein
MKQLNVIRMISMSVAALALIGAQNSFAIGDAAKELQAQWDVVKYQTSGKEREKEFKKLVELAKQTEASHPNDAEVLVWEAIILSSYAGEKGGLGALSLVKEAKATLEKAEKLNASILDGAIYTSLGSLYYQVPGWPIGFGDGDKAEEYLKKALAKAPNDIDANFFYGDFLIEEGKYAQAVQVLEKALNAPARPGRDIADTGRKEEINKLLEKARKKL